MTHKSRTNEQKVFKLGSNVGNVTRHAHQLFKVKRSKVKVTNHMTYQQTKKIIDVGVDACGIISR